MTKSEPHVALQAKPLPLAFDTSALPRSLVRVSPEWRYLSSLAPHRVTLHLPEIARREWLAQREEEAMTAAHEFVTATRRLENMGFPSALVRRAKRLREAVSSLAHLELRGERALQQLSLVRYPIDDNDHKAMFDSYFEGNPPFSGRRARQDLPDAMIFQSVVRLHAQDKRLIAVVGDKRLRAAIEQHGIHTAEDVAGLLRSEPLLRLAKDSAFGVRWFREASSVSNQLRKHSKTIAARVAPQLSVPLTGVQVRHESIPEDNHEASIDWEPDVSPDDIRFDWKHARTLGVGMLLVPISFECVVSLSFPVFRAEAFDVPDWVHVSIGDFEEDPYFEASGDRRARFTALVGFFFKEADLAHPSDHLPEHIDVSHLEFHSFVDGVDEAAKPTDDLD